MASSKGFFETRSHRLVIRLLCRSWFAGVRSVPKEKGSKEQKHPRMASSKGPFSQEDFTFFSVSLLLAPLARLQYEVETFSHQSPSKAS